MKSIDSVGWLATAVALTAQLAVGCEISPQDAPAVEISYPYGEGMDVVIDSLLYVDVATHGCNSGIGRLAILQGEEEVFVETREDRLAQTRFQVAADRLEWTGRSYPARIELMAQVTCCRGASAVSQPESIDLLPAARRLGDWDTRWPGYFFWPSSSGSFLFCDQDRLLRVDHDGVELGRSSGEVDCGRDTRVVQLEDQILVTDGQELVALEEDLSERFRIRADRVTLSDDRILAVEQAGGAFPGPITLSEVSSTNGSTLWTAQLDGPGVDWPIGLPLFDEQGFVRLLTVSASLNPLQGTYLAWSVDPAEPDQPTYQEVAQVPVTEESPDQQALVAPLGMLLGRGRLAIVAEYGLDANGTLVALHLRALDLDAGSELWAEPLEGLHPSFLNEGHGLLVTFDGGFLRVDSDGRLAGRHDLAAGERIRQVICHHPQAGLVFTLEDDSGAQHSIRMLDGDLNTVWTVLYPWAFGAQFAPAGKLFFLSADMLQMFDAVGYLDLTR